MKLKLLMNALFLALSFIVICQSVFAQTPTNAVAVSEKASHINNTDGINAIFTTLNFRKNCSFWYGPVPFKANHRFIANEYQNKKYGWLRICFYPRDPKLVKVLDSLDHVLERQHKYLWMKDYVLKDNNLQKFNLWAIFVDKKYDKELPDGDDYFTYGPTYPCKVQLYKNTNNVWEFVKSAWVTHEGREFDLFPKYNFETGEVY